MIFNILTIITVVIVFASFLGGIIYSIYQAIKSGNFWSTDTGGAVICVLFIIFVFWMIASLLNVLELIKS